MDKYITISKGMVEVKEEVIHNRIPFKKWLDEASKLAPLNTGVLPQGCIYFEKRGDTRFFIIERAPRNYFLKHFNTVHKIALPFLYYIVKVNEQNVILNKTGLFQTIRKIGSLDEPVMVPWLPNIDNGGVLCLGEIRINCDQPTNLVIDELVDLIMTSNFNSDLMGKTSPEFIEFLMKEDPENPLWDLEKVKDIINNPDNHPEITNKPKFIGQAKNLGYDPANHPGRYFNASDYGENETSFMKLAVPWVVIDSLTEKGTYNIVTLNSRIAKYLVTPGKLSDMVKAFWREGE